ncbi:MAG: rRNA (guanosine-2-O-)-methyltransferase RlmB [Pseudomonadota bacterium]|jgi:23S rRNA (guanosine2251-2'-O)-methyltransferase
MSSILKKEFIFGFHAIDALLKSHPEKICRLYRQEGRDDKRMQAILQLADAQAIPIQSVSKQQCDIWANAGVHQGVLAEIKAVSKQFNERDLFNLLTQRLQDETRPPFLLVLDEVQDPHNLGACLRSANAAGVDAVIIPQDRSASMSATVRKIAAGAAETTPLFSVTNLASTLDKLKKAGIWCYGLDQCATQSIYATALTGALALVLGAEGKGLRRLTKERCDALIAIPMLGTVNSLNVSVAAGICLFEALRQRQ